MQSGTQKSSQIQGVGGGKRKVEMVSGRRPECLGKKKALIGLEHHELCDPSHRSERNCFAVPQRKEILPSPAAPPHCSRARRLLNLDLGPFNLISRFRIRRRPSSNRPRSTPCWSTSLTHVSTNSRAAIVTVWFGWRTISQSRSEERRVGKECRT